MLITLLHCHGINVTISFMFINCNLFHVVGVFYLLSPLQVEGFLSNNKFQSQKSEHWTYLTTRYKDLSPKLPSIVSSDIILFFRKKNLKIVTLFNYAEPTIFFGISGVLTGKGFAFARTLPSSLHLSSFQWTV